MNIQVRDLYKSFGDNPVLRGLELDIQEGEITVILGGSGTGKSVFLKHLVGIFRPDQGQIFLDGTDIVPLSEKNLLPWRLKVGLIFQGGSLLANLNVLDNVALGLREHRLKKESEIQEIARDKLELMGLGDKGEEMPSNLSGGMKKRVAIARTLTMNPDVILYDEPTAGLDPPRAKSVDGLIQEMRDKTGVTSVLVTHDLISAFELGDTIHFMKEGQILCTGSPTEFAKSDREEVRHFLERGPVRTTEKTKEAD